jgi:hypothetical protein
VQLPWQIEVISDHFSAPPSGLPEVTGPPKSLGEALAGKLLLACWHKAEVEHLAGEHNVDLVLADGFRVGAGLGAERLGLPWVAYTHRYFDEAGTSEGMVEYYCQRFGRPVDAADVFASWWPEVLGSFDGPAVQLEADERCWWNLSSHATLVLGLPELKVHQRPAPAYVVRVGPSLWQPSGADLPELADLGRDRPSVLVALSTNPVGDEPLVVASGAWVRDFDLAVTAGSRPLPDLPDGVRAAGDLPHGQLMDLVCAVVCSAGHGTVTRAACAGVPVIAAPRMGDQFLVADAVEATGLGVRIEPDQEPGVISSALAEVLALDPAPIERLGESASHYDAVVASLAEVERVIS